MLLMKQLGHFLGSIFQKNCKQSFAVRSSPLVTLLQFVALFFSHQQRFLFGTEEGY